MACVACDQWLQVVEVVAAQQQGQRRDHRAVGLGVLVEIEQRDGKELQVLGYAEVTCRCASVKLRRE